MARDAERFAGEDKKRREVVDLKNQADSMAYQAEKQLKELGGKLEGAQKSELEGKIGALKKAAQGEDAEALKRAIAEFEQAMHKVSEKLYSGAGGGAGGGGGPQPGATAGAGKGGGGSARGGGDEDIKDADFEVK
jgi:molecular chaperone DnaK